MRYLVRWEYAGIVHACFASTIDAAQTIVQAIAAFYSGDEVRVQLWLGKDLKREVVS